MCCASNEIHPKIPRFWHEDALLYSGTSRFIDSGKFMVAGRNCQDELRRGDRLRVRDKTGAESPEFYVDEIMFYNRPVEAVDRGHTAGLLFPNDLAAHVRLGDELRGQSNV
jgi:hypothetical protein